MGGTGRQSAKKEGDASLVLLVTGERPLLRDLEERLQDEGYKVASATSIDGALSRVRRSHPDLVVLEPSLAGTSGLDAVRLLRAETSVPMMVISTADQEVDKIVALELGADDYVAMPVSMREVLARTRSLLRRRQRTATSIDRTRKMQFGSLQIDLARREVTNRRKLVELRPREFELLVLLAEHPGRVFTREQLLSQVWGYESYGRTRTVDVHIDRLRRKLGERRAGTRHIVTIRGAGYRFDG